MKPKLDSETRQRAKDIIFGEAKNITRDKGLDNFIIWLLNSKTSGELKEELVVEHLGLKSKGDVKHGYDAWTKEGRPVEFKPETWYEGGSKTSGLSGGGSFNDLAEHKRKKFCQEDLLIITAGFYEENLLYIFRFPYRVVDPSIDAQITHTIDENQKRKDKGSSRIVPRFGFNDIRGYKEVERLFIRRDIFAYKAALNETNLSYIKSDFPNGNRSIPLTEKQKAAIFNIGTDGTITLPNE